MSEFGLNKSSFLGIFKIKSEEVNGFMLMLIHAFLSGLGIALAFTAISTLIVDYHAVHDLPRLYIITSVLLLISGYIYSKAEHSFQPSAVFKGVLIIITMWAIMMSFNMTMFHSLTIVTIAFCSYYIIYYLNNLEYWGAAALMFNVRQGKRLFGLLSVGESLAKISGYAITPLIITKLNFSWVFIVIAFCFAGSFLIFMRLSRISKDLFTLNHHHHHEDENKSTGKLSNLSIAQILKIDDFRKFISIFALLSSLSYFLIHYAFLLKVEERFVDLEQIAIFFASLFSVAKFLNLIIKVFFAGRLLQYLGLRYILLLLPATLFFIIIIGLGLVYFGQFNKSIFIWIFTIIILVDEVFRSSLYTPSYLILFQPLSKTKRLEGHTLSKGIMEPIGIGLAGIIIVLLFKLEKFDLELLSFIIVIVLLIWIFAGTKVFKAYINILQNALKTKLLSRGSFQLSKDELVLLREQKLDSSDAREKYYALQLLSSSMEKEEIKKHISLLLKDSNPYIIKSSIGLCSEYDIDGLEGIIAPFINHKDKELSELACYEYARMVKEDCVDLFKSKLNNDNGVHNSVVGAAIKHGGLPGAIEFGRELLNLIDSKEEEKRMNGATIIGDIANDKYFSPLIKLFSDPSISVRLAAIKAAGKIKNNALIPHIFDARNDRKLVRYCKDSLANFGNQATEYLIKEFGEIGISDDIKLIKLIENHQFRTTNSFYHSILNHQNFDLKKEVVNILYKRSYLRKKDKNDQIFSLQSNILTSIDRLIKYIQESNSAGMENLIYNELYNIQLPLLYKCLSFIHPRKAINEIISNSFILDGEYRTNAIELLENTLHPKDTRRVITLIEKIFEYEPRNHEDKWGENDEKIIREIILNENKDFSSWIVANCIRIANQNNFQVEIPESLKKLDIEIIKQEISKLYNQNN